MIQMLGRKRKPSRGGSLDSQLSASDQGSQNAVVASGSNDVGPEAANAAAAEETTQEEKPSRRSPAIHNPFRRSKKKTKNVIVDGHLKDGADPFFVAAAASTMVHLVHPAQPPAELASPPLAVITLDDVAAMDVASVAPGPRSLGGKSGRSGKSGGSRSSNGSIFSVLLRSMSDVWSGSINSVVRAGRFLSPRSKSPSSRSVAKDAADAAAVVATASSSDATAAAAAVASSTGEDESRERFEVDDWDIDALMADDADGLDDEGTEVDLASLIDLSQLEVALLAQEPLDGAAKSRDSVGSTDDGASSREESSSVESGSASSRRAREKASRNTHGRKEWAPHEDKLILELAAKHGQKWRLISSQLPGRTDDSVRNRWKRLVALDPSQQAVAVADALGSFLDANDGSQEAMGGGGEGGAVASARTPPPAPPVVAIRKTHKASKPSAEPSRQAWSQAEDAEIVRCVSAYGLRWSKIAQHLPARTPHAIRNRFHRLQALQGEQAAAANVVPPSPIRDAAGGGWKPMVGLTMPDDFSKLC